MPSKPTADKPTGDAAQPSGHGRFAQTLRRFRGRSAAPARTAQDVLPARTASAGTRRPTMRSAAAVPPPPERPKTAARPAAHPAPSSTPNVKAATPSASAQQPAKSVPPAPASGNPASSTPDAPVWTLRWNWTPLLIGVAVLCWIIALSMLFTGSSPMAPRLSSPRTTFVVVWLLASAITFIPIEYRLGLPGLTVQGVAGWTLLGYLLAYAPPPTGWLLDLPDLPVYLLFFLALFYAISAATLPLTVLAGQRFWSHRLLRLDMRRARRQSYELGILIVGLLVLAGLRVLTPLTGVLFLAVMVLVEMLLLSQVAPEG